MEKKLILRGLLAGAVAGVLAFVFARIFAEPQIGKAVAYESGREAAAGGAHEHEHEVFSRAVQANVGIGVGVVLFGLAMGVLFAVVYAVCLGRVGGLRPRTLALLVAGAGFLGMYLVPFLKYPANPPAVGDEGTIQQRTGYYLAMVVASLFLLVAAAWLGKRLAGRYGNWNASLLAGAAFVLTIGVVMLLLPSYHETPGALTDAKGTIVFPGFPADVLFSYRFYSVAAQLIMWAALGLVFAPLAERVLNPRTSPAEAGKAARPSPAAA